MTRTYNAAAKSLNNRATVQTRPIPGRNDMVNNNAAGFVFETGKWKQLDRFLILGSEGNTYYVSGTKMTQENAKNVVDCIHEDGVRVVNRIVEISESGRAPKNDPALFTLALVLSFGDQQARTEAASALTKVARIGTHLLHLAEYVNSMRGWGRGIRRAFSDWYLTQSPEKLAMNLVKYANRDGWTHRDVLRMAHPKARGVYQELLAYAADKPHSFSGHEVNEFMTSVNEIKKTSPHEINKAVELITTNNLPREVIPTELLNSAKVWEALLPHMGLTAMIRNLATMTRIGLLTSTSDATRLVLEKLSNEEILRKARIHPIQILAAILTYSEGRGFRGTNTWTPVTKIVDCLDEAFYVSFGLVRPTGKRVVYGLDISGSMDGGLIAGVPGLTPRVAVATLAMLAARTEKDSVYLGFTSGGRTVIPSGYKGRYNYGGYGVTEIDITSKHRLDTVVQKMRSLPMGGTDASLPILWADQNNVKADAFVIMTDNETWAGSIHPTQALNNYRKKTGIVASMVVVGMTATNFTIADPTDPRQLDVVGFDTAAPNLISDFIRGDL